MGAVFYPIGTHPRPDRSGIAPSSDTMRGSVRNPLRLRIFEIEREVLAVEGEDEVIEDVAAQENVPSG